MASAVHQQHEQRQCAPVLSGQMQKQGALPQQPRALASDLGSQLDQLDQQKQERQRPASPPLPPSPAQWRGSSCSCCECAADSLRSRTLWYYAPYWLFMVVDGLLGSVSLLLMSIVCASLVACMLVAGLVLKRSRLIRVAPKTYDVFNFVFFTALIPVAALQRPWLHRYIDVLSSSCNAAYMLASITVGRCWPRDAGHRWRVWNFIEEAELDRLSDAQAADPVVAAVMSSACLRAAIGWAAALGFMCAASAVTAALGVKEAAGASAAGIAAGIALSNGPLALALVWHCVVLHRGRRRLLRYYQQGELEQLEQGEGEQGEQQQQQQQQVASGQDNAVMHGKELGIITAGKPCGGTGGV